MLAKTAAVALLAVLALMSAIACAGASASDAPLLPPMAADNAQNAGRLAPAAPALVEQNNPPPAPATAVSAAAPPDTNPAILKDDTTVSSHSPIYEKKDLPAIGAFSVAATERYVAELKAQDARFTPDTATPDQTAVINDAIACLSTQAQGQLPDALIREVVWAEAAASASDASIVAHAINQCSLAQASGSGSGDDPRVADAMPYDGATANTIISVDDALAQCEQGAASLPTATAAAVRLCTSR